MGQWMSCSIVSVNDTSTYRDLRARAYYHSTDGVSDSSNGFSTSGDFPGNVNDVSKSISLPYGGGSQLLHEKTLRVYKQFGKTTNAYFAASIDGINYWGTGDQAYDNASYDVPARAWLPPDKPSTPSVTAYATKFIIDWTFPDGNGDAPNLMHIQVATSSSFSSSSLVKDYNDGASPAGPSGLTKGKTYYIRIRAKNKGGPGPWSNTVTKKTLTTTPTVPGVPSVSSVSDTHAVASWSDPSDWGGDNSSEFDVDVSGGPDYPNITGNSKTLGDLTPNATNKVRVQAQNNAGEGPYSGWRSFLTKPLPTTSVSVTSITPSGAAFAANEPSGGAAEYRYQVATDSGFTNLIYDEQNTSRQRTISGLSPASTYYIRSVAKNDSGSTGWQAETSFTTLAGAYVYTSGGWENATPYVWTGSEWAEAAAYVWRNGAWRR